MGWHRRLQTVIVELLRKLQHERRLAMIFISSSPTTSLVRSIAQTVAVLSNKHSSKPGPTAGIELPPTPTPPTSWKTSPNSPPHQPDKAPDVPGSQIG